MLSRKHRLIESRAHLVTWSACQLLILLLAGCTTLQPPVDSALLSRGNDGHDGPAVIGCYVVGCPDVLELAIGGHPKESGQRAIDVDGRIDLGTLGRVRVEGLSVPEVGRAIAELTGAPRDHVQVQVAEYRSQQIFLFGQVVGWPRAVAYQGPEKVSELLQRVGGITSGAAPDDVYVIRGRVPEGHAPEVYHVNLRAIVLEHDERTNIRLQPFDQLYVGQNRRSTLEKCVPPCLQPLYECFFGLYRPDGAK